MEANWSRVSLKELATKVGSGATPRGGKAVYRESGTPFIRSMNIIFFGFKRDGLVYLDVDQAKALKNVTVQTGDVLLNITGASIGRVTLAPPDMEGARVNQHVCIIRPIELIDARYLNAFLSSPEMQSIINAENYGVTRQALTKQQILNFKVPLAPYSEQKRIAEKLDSTISRVDACRERLDRVPGKLKNFRQAILSAATSGKLTEDWRPAGLPLNNAGWKRTFLESLLDGKPRNGYSPRAVEHKTFVKSLTLTATTTGTFLPQHFKYIDEDIPATSHLWLQPGDILIQRANTLEYVGVSAVYDGPPSGFIYPDLMMKCRANEQVLTQYLHYILLSEPVRRYFRDNATGTAGNMPKINQKTVLGAPTFLPPLEEQQVIVARVESLFAIANRLEANLNNAYDRVEKLTSSLLAKAFRGELVPQDPNDEPVSQLLERIRAPREVVEIKRLGKLPQIKASSMVKYEQIEVKMLSCKDVTETHLTAILQKKGRLTPEELWQASKLEIDDFYEQLKDEEAKGLLKELRGDSQNRDRFLEAVA